MLIKMDPSHLTSTEVEYELLIRGIPSFDENNLNINALKKSFELEAIGVKKLPQMTNLLNKQEEIQICLEISKDIIEDCAESVLNRSFINVIKLATRAQHIIDRVKRIIPSSAEEQEIISDISDRCNEILIRRHLDGRLALSDTLENSDVVNESKTSLNYSNSEGLSVISSNLKSDSFNISLSAVELGSISFCSANTSAISSSSTFEDIATPVCRSNATIGFGC